MATRSRSRRWTRRWSCSTAPGCWRTAPGAGGDGLARASADQALDLTRAAGYRLLAGQALTASAALHLAAGGPDRAVAEGQRALAIHAETGHRPGAARAHALLVRARERTGDPAAARDHHRRCRELLAARGIAPAALA